MDNILKRSILHDLGLDTLPKEQQEEALLKVGKIIFQGVMIRVLEVMNEGDKDAFEKLLAERPDDEEAVFAFLREKVPNLDAVVKEEVTTFKEESAGLMQQITRK